jgi:hypothetical protein
MLQEKLRIAAEENIEKKKKITPEEYEQMYTKESRVQQYKDMQEQKRQEEERSKQNSMFSDFREFDQQ